MPSENSMHILYLITRAEMGGSQTHLLELLRGFRHEFRLSLATGEEGFLTEAARNLGVETFVLPNLVQPLDPLKDVKALKEMIQLLQRVKPDLIHCHTSKAGIVGRAAARAVSVPAVFTAHTWSFADGTSRMWKLIGTPSERLAARFTTKIIAVSDSNRDLAIRQKVAPEYKIITVHNGIPDTGYRARPDRSGIPRIAMVARFAPQKNQQQLLSALADVNLPFKLTFVGDGPTRHAVEQLTAELGLAPRVEFLGVRRDTDQILAASELFVLATNWEGFPITILEAMRAGLPVIATDVDGVREAVLDGQTGYLVPRGDTDALREKLVLLLGNANLRARLGAAGRAVYEREFTRPVMLDKIAAIYRGAVPVFERPKAASQSA
jgi:glycosyltransferase involved in cell wall biosynthesis